MTLLAHYMPLLAGVALFAFGLWLLWPMRRKPLYADDGVWFYYAVFRHRGLRLFANYKNGLSYVSVEWIFAALYRLFGRPEPAFFYDVKSVWYALTACATYLLGWQLYDGSYLVPLAAGVTLLLMMAWPRTKFALTFAEHMLLLPLLLSTSAMWQGVQTGAWWWFALTGLLAGWAMQMKIVALLPAVLLPLLCLAAPKGWLALAAYAAGLVAVNVVLPCLFLLSWRRSVLYLGTNLIGLLTYARSVLAMLRLPSAWLGRVAAGISGWLAVRILRLPKKPQSGGSAYVERRLGKSPRAVWGEFVQLFWPLVRQTPLLWLPALAMLAYAALVHEADLLLLLGLFVALWLTQLVQKSFFPCHVNQLWPAVALLAAIAVGDTIRYLLYGGYVLGVAMLVLFVAVQWLALLLPALRHRKENILADYPPGFAAHFEAAATVGRWLRQHTSPDDKLLVWGNMPSIYIYARREIAMPRQFKKQMFSHIYPVRHGEVHAGIAALFQHMRVDPPRWLVMFTPGKQDAWTIERIVSECGVPYALHHVVQHTRPDGKLLRVPVFQRQDALLHDMLIEQWRLDDADLAAQRMRNVFPNDAELTHRMELTKLPPEQHEEHLRACQPQDDAQRRTRLLLLAEAYRDGGNLPAAQEVYGSLLMETPQHPRAMLGLAETMFMAGEAQQSLALAQAAMRANPFLAEACNDVGVMLHAAGQPQQARGCFARALELLPGYAAAAENLAQLEPRA